MDDETITCQFCRKVLHRVGPNGRWNGSMARMLQTHQSSRECLLIQAEILKRLTSSESSSVQT